GDAGRDHLVVDHVGRHPAQRQVTTALADDLVAGREADQVGEALDRDGVAVADELGDGVTHRNDLRARHAARSLAPTHRSIAARAIARRLDPRARAGHAPDTRRWALDTKGGQWARPRSAHLFRTPVPITSDGEAHMRSVARRPPIVRSGL